MKLRFDYLTLILLLIVITSNSAQCQMFPGGSEGKEFSFIDETTTEEPESYLEINGKIPNMVKNWGLELGIALGSYFTKNFSIGAEFNYLFTQTHKFKITQQGQEAHLRLVYGGVDFDALLPIGRDFFASSRLALLFGNLSYGTHSSFDIASDPSGKWLFLGSFAVGLNARISGKWFIGANVCWRSPFALKYNGLTSKNRSGMIFKISLKNVL